MAILVQCFQNSALLAVCGSTGALALVDLARREIGLEVGDRQEPPGRDQRDDDGEQAPARHQDEFVADVLVGLDADHQHEQAEGDGAGDRAPP